MDFLKKLLRPKPWQELEKGFKLDLQCEECGTHTNQLWTVQELLCCNECREAKVRRARFLQEEAEWEEYQNDN
jgi:hypothetical protein